MANGKVVEKRSIGTVGQVLVLEHTHRNGNIYSVYLHVDINSGLQEGNTVTKNQWIARIADISPSFAHLHFELRTKAVLSGDLYVKDFDNSGYYVTLRDLEADGFTVNPSDFIDANRRCAAIVPILQLLLGD